MLYRNFVRKQALRGWKQLSERRIEDTPLADDIHFVFSATLHWPLICTALKRSGHGSGAEFDVRIEDVGVGPSGLREDVDDAHRDKYGGGSTGNMVGDEAAATTLRLLRK